MTNGSFRRLYAAGVKRVGRTGRTHSLVILYLEHGRNGGQAGPRNNAGLKKLKKRARRAAITSDASRPNDRHLSRRSRRYAKSPLLVDDSSNVGSESYKQTACCVLCILREQNSCFREITLSHREKEKFFK